MTSHPQPLQFRRWKAPRSDHSVYCDPPRSELASVVARNSALRERQETTLLGRSWQALADSARADLCEAARRYSRTYRDVSLPDLPERAGPLILTGHQAELFHPGVWAKNFGLAHLAGEVAGTPIHLVVDSDLVKDTSLRVPAGSLAEPRFQAIEFDLPSAEFPAERQQVRDPARWHSFASRVCETLQPFVKEPLLREFWPLVLARSQAGVPQALCFAQARHQWEARWGLQTYEVPLSQTCRFAAFAWFAGMLLAEAPRFAATYNEAIREYRALYRIRSRNHPVPFLSREDDWQEAPFWLWTNNDPRRRRVFVRNHAQQLWISDREQVQLALPLSPERDGRAGVEQLAQLPEQGVHLRTRALTTTLWARLFLSDLFLHGIGGARYDQLTDLLSARFFGLEPLSYATLSATCLLPVPQPAATEVDLKWNARELRDLDWNPDRFFASEFPLSEDSLGEFTPYAEKFWDAQELQDLLSEREKWIRAMSAVPAQTVDLAQRHREIRRLNRALQPWLNSRRAALLNERTFLQAELRRARVLGSREFSFSLYPEAPLRDFLARNPSL